MYNSILVTIINYQTPDLLKISFESFRNYYPNVQVLLIDNGSRDNSPEVINKLIEKFPSSTQNIFLEKNFYHGPAMHKAICITDKEYIFFLDSDTETKKGGFLEQMYEQMQNSKNTYAIGRQIIVNKRGFLSNKGTPILTPAYLMLRVNMYKLLPKFEHHGQPALKNFIAAHKKGYLLKSFPIEEFIEHNWRGTASRFGYGLGLKGKIDFVLNKLGI